MYCMWRITGSFAKHALVCVCVCEIVRRTLVLAVEHCRQRTISLCIGVERLIMENIYYTGENVP